MRPRAPTRALAQGAVCQRARMQESRLVTCRRAVQFTATPPGLPATNSNCNGTGLSHADELYKSRPRQLGYQRRIRARAELNIQDPLSPPEPGGVARDSPAKKKKLPGNLVTSPNARKQQSCVCAFLPLKRRVRRAPYDGLLYSNGITSPQQCRSGPRAYSSATSQSE